MDRFYWKRFDVKIKWKCQFFNAVNAVNWNLIDFNLFPFVCLNILSFKSKWSRQNSGGEESETHHEQDHFTFCWNIDQKCTLDHNDCLLRKNRRTKSSSNEDLIVVEYLFKISVFSISKLTFKVSRSRIHCWVWLCDKMPEQIYIFMQQLNTKISIIRRYVYIMTIISF